MPEQQHFTAEGRYEDLGSFTYLVTAIENEHPIVHCHFFTDEGSEGDVAFALERLAEVNPEANNLFVGTRFHLHEIKNLDSGAITSLMCVEPFDIEMVVASGMERLDAFLSENSG